MSHLCGSSGTVQVVKVKHVLKYFAEMKWICARGRLLPRWELVVFVSLTICKRDLYKTMKTHPSAVRATIPDF